MLKNFIQASVVVGVGLIAGNADAQAVQWRVADGGNGHWYQFVPNLQSTWTAARSAAQAQGGHLATISGQSENAFMGSVVGWASSSWSSEVFGPFIGATRQGLSEWHWVTDEPWNFQGWASGEPNNDSGGAGPEDCLALSRTWMGTDILWNDVTNTGCAGATCQIRTSSGFVVEWESDCNSDGIVDYGQILNGSLLDTNTNGVPDCCDQGVSCEVNLVNNGGFEQGAAQACGWVCIPTGSTSLVGWDVVLNTVDRQRTIVGVCYEGWLARSGEYSIDLNGCSWGGKIQQSLTTVVGATYRLTFGLSLNPVPAVGYVRVFTGATQTDFSFQRADTSPQPWHEHFVNFTASSTSTVIAFESLNREAPDQWNGPVIDDVSVVLIHQSNCRGDIFADGLINGGDLGVMLSYWGQVTNTAQSRACDLNVDGNVDGSDLGVLLSNWGPCNG